MIQSSIEQKKAKMIYDIFGVIVSYNYFDKYLINYSNIVENANRPFEYRWINFWDIAWS